MDMTMSNRRRGSHYQFAERALKRQSRAFSSSLEIWNRFRISQMAMVLCSVRLSSCAVAVLGQTMTATQPRDVPLCNSCTNTLEKQLQLFEHTTMRSCSKDSAGVTKPHLKTPQMI